MKDNKDMAAADDSRDVLLDMCEVTSRPGSPRRQSNDSGYENEDSVKLLFCTNVPDKVFKYKFS